MSESNDLDRLIRQAENTARTKGGLKPAPTGKSITFRLIFCVLLAGVIGYSGMRISEALAPPTQQKIAQDLGVVVERAHVLIDGIRKDTGELPATLPNAALASVVKYELRDKQYKLTATILGVRVTFEGDGKMKTEIEK